MNNQAPTRFTATRLSGALGTAGLSLNLMGAALATAADTLLVYRGVFQ